MEMKIKSKTFMVKIEDILVWTDDEWLPSGQELISAYI